MLWSGPGAAIFLLGMTAHAIDCLITGRKPPADVSMQLRAWRSSSELGGRPPARKCGSVQKKKPAGAAVSRPRFGEYIFVSLSASFQI
jgi:hypothetical protein